MKERFFIVCYFNGIAHGRTFVVTHNDRFVNIIALEEVKKCTITFVYEFQTKEDWLNAQNEGV